MSTAEEIRWDSFKPEPDAGPTPGGRDIPRSAKSAAARGLDGTGLPLGPTSAAPPMPGHQPRKGGKTLSGQVDAIENGDVHDLMGLHQFTEQARKLCAGLAVFVEMSSGELLADAKAMGKGAGDGRLSVADRLRLKLTLRKVAKKLHATAEHFADAGGNAADAWRIMKTAVDEMEYRIENKPKSKRKGFDVFSGQ